MRLVAQLIKFIFTESWYIQLTSHYVFQIVSGNLIGTRCYYKLYLLRTISVINNNINFKINVKFPGLGYTAATLP